jgi:hypothetical protein
LFCPSGRAQTCHDPTSSIFLTWYLLDCRCLPTLNARAVQCENTSNPDPVLLGLVTLHSRADQSHTQLSPAEQREDTIRAQLDGLNTESVCGEEDTADTVARLGKRWRRHVSKNARRLLAAMPVFSAGFLSPAEQQNLEILVYHEHAALLTAFELYLHNRYSHHTPHHARSFVFFAPTQIADDVCLWSAMRRLGARSVKQF